ncbi:MAG TPA: amino acid permease [Rubrobacteraceae bacterium]|nr:amino acid permease [Rubrobacteraceae bacterium]
MAEATGTTQQGAQAEDLKKQLKMRHMTMISLGGVIGAGLFVGSGTVIGAVGPAAVLSYLMAGIILLLVMRMLGEMAVTRPVVGSFAEYARMALGGWAGFTIGWLYWFFWVVVVAVEAVAGAGILETFIPGVPLWLFCLILVSLLTATNLYSVGAFGEFEFWFASIKVVAIITFLALGTIFVLGLWPGASLDFSNLTSHGGFFPNGPFAAFNGIVTVIFAFVGAEIVTIAAAESAEPGRGVARAVNTVIYRVMIFYVGSIFLVVTILPWNANKALGRGPYSAVLDHIGIPGASTIMALVVLTAVLSCLNSGLYTASRMLNSLSRRGDAPKFFLDVTRRGVPAKAILISTSVGFLAVIAAYVSPETVFQFLLNASGAIALFVYLLVALSELILRRRFEREAPERMQLKMWLYPYLTIFTIVVFVAIIISMGIIPDTRSQLALSLLSAGIVVAAYFLIRRRFGGGQQQTVDATSPSDRGER